jgi:pilus assembly protein CpaB
VFRLRDRLPRLGRWPRLLGATCCLLLAAGSALGAKPGQPTAGPAAGVVVAARPLPAGHVLTHDDLVVERWPARVRPATARGDPAALAGRRLAGSVGRGEPITTSRLLGSDLATALPAGMVASAVSLGDPHAADLVRPGDRVDLLEADRAVDPLTAGPTSPPHVAVLTTNSLVLAVLPASAAADAELVVAVDQTTAVRITRDSATQMFTAVAAPP